MRFTNTFKNKLTACLKMDVWNEHGCSYLLLDMREVYKVLAQVSYFVSFPEVVSL